MLHVLNKTIISLILTIFLIGKINTFKCDVKNLNVTPGIVETIQNNENQRLLEEATYNDIVISYVNETLENSANNGGPIDIIKQLLDEVIPLFKTFLKIKTKSQINEPKLNDLINTRCNVNITQENITEIINENDITIFPYFKDFNQSEDEDITWMRGKFCLITRDLRPLGGFLEINEKIKDVDFNSGNSKEYFKHILFHEITHILLFDKGLLDALGLVKDNQITTETVKQVARHHYNCMEFLLEDDFGIPLDEDGYHWDSKYMLGDYMISFDYFDKTISDMTFALFDDSGIYQIKKLYGKYFNFGYNKSCSFFQSKCSANFEEFCNTVNVPKCSQSRMSKGICSNITNTGCISSNYENQSGNYYFSTSCKYGNNIGEDPLETFGNNSFCFISSLNNSNNNETKCYEVECDSKNRNIKVIFKDDINNVTKTINCPKDGGVISNPIGLFGTLTCPKYTEICSENNDFICRDMLDCINETFARDYIIHGEDFSELIRFNMLFIFINLFNFIFS